LSGPRPLHLEAPRERHQRGPGALHPLSWQFDSFPRLPRDFTVPIGPPDPDPAPGSGTQWPGSASFAQAFGRLADNALTGFELPPSHIPRLIAVIGLPAAAHTLRTGGRVIWIPSPQTPASFLYTELLRFVPRDVVQERLRILSAGGYEDGPEELRSIRLPIRAGSREGPGASGSGGPHARPAFPDAVDFFREDGTGKPALVVLSLEGLRALAAVSGVRYDRALFSLILESYKRLPRFHGLGFGRSDDPLTLAALPSAGTHLKIQERFGRTVIFGARPETSPYVLGWTQPEGRYTLLPIL
jgi:hypothetical protein